MKLEELERYFSLLANLGVIIGIVFLVIELNQNNELLAAQDRFNRLQVSNYGFNLFLEDADLPRIFYDTAPSDRTESEKRIVSYYWSNLMRGFEWTFIELPKDELPTEKWRRSIDCEFILESWDRQKPTYDAGFVEYFEANILSNCS